MNFYKNEQGQVAAFSDDDMAVMLRDDTFPDGLIAISENEANALRSIGFITAQSLKDDATALRWKHETGGITLPSGVPVATAIDDQNRITSVVANAERAGLNEVDFKSAQGWVKITLVELQAIAATVARHVQACFSAERAHHEAIDALQVQNESAPQVLQAALNAYDVAQGWPSADLRLPG